MDTEEILSSESQLLMEFLREEPGHTEMPQPLWTRLQERYGKYVHQELLYALTQMHFDVEEARIHWEAIIAHRKHLRQTLGRDPGLRVTIADYFVNVHPRVKNPIIVEINIFLQKEESAFRDDLTGLYNRRFFNKMLQREIERARRFHESVSMLMLDVDHFKDFNDSFGHPEGDRALAEMAGVFRQSCRAIDYLTRYGGEEFAIILPRADIGQSIQAAERHREAVGTHNFQCGHNSRLTISIGAATFPHDAGDGLQLLERADQALYQAKAGGRNRVFAYSQEKRLHRRCPADIELTIISGRFGQSIEGRTRDISTGGVLARIRERVEGDGDVEVRLAARPGQPSLTVPGRCVRFDRDEDDPSMYNLGIRFHPLGPNDLDALRLFIQNQSPSSV